MCREWRCSPRFGVVHPPLRRRDEQGPPHGGLAGACAGPGGLRGAADGPARLWRQFRRFWRRQLAKLGERRGARLPLAAQAKQHIWRGFGPDAAVAVGPARWLSAGGGGGQATWRALQLSVLAAARCRQAAAATVLAPQSGGRSAGRQSQRRHGGYAPALGRWLTGRNCGLPAFAWTCIWPGASGPGATYRPRPDTATGMVRAVHARGCRFESDLGQNHRPVAASGLYG